MPRQGLPYVFDDAADGRMEHSRIEELRDLARALAEDDNVEPVLRVIAGSVRTITDAVAVHIERYTGPELASIALASAGPNVASADDLNAQIEDTDRIVISLGRRHERLGAIVLWRRRTAPPVSPEQLERIGDLSVLAVLALQRKLLHEDLHRTREDHQSAIENKFRLISGISEELRNRLGVAGEYVQLLDTEGELNPREKKYIAGSRRSIDAAVHLINEMVQLARAETGRMSLQLEPVNIGAVLRGIVRDYQLEIGNIGVAFDVAIPDLPTIETDIDAVRQILDNLLSNAVRYTPAGGRINVQADIRPGRRKSDPSKYVCLAVADTGPGVGDQDLIFEEVYRVERRGNHPGFRLAISRRIARLLGGELTLETSDDGSVFTLWLPGTSVDPKQERQ
jgi:signal transduction histidine kinase